MEIKAIVQLTAVLSFLFNRELPRILSILFISDKLVLTSSASSSSPSCSWHEQAHVLRRWPLAFRLNITRKVRWGSEPLNSLAGPRPLKASQISWVIANLLTSDTRKSKSKVKTGFLPNPSRVIVKSGVGDFPRWQKFPGPARRMVGLPNETTRPGGVSLPWGRPHLSAAGVSPAIYFNARVEASYLVELQELFAFCKLTITQLETASTVETRSSHGHVSCAFFKIPLGVNSCFFTFAPSSDVISFSYISDLVLRLSGIKSETNTFFLLFAHSRTSALVSPIRRIHFRLPFAYVRLGNSIVFFQSQNCFRYAIPTLPSLFLR